MLIIMWKWCLQGAGKTQRIWDVCVCDLPWGLCGSVYHTPAAHLAHPAAAHILCRYVTLLRIFCTGLSHSYAYSVQVCLSWAHSVQVFHTAVYVLCR